MAWIKRNLIFVIAVAVGVALMGVAIFFLFGSISENQELSDKIQQAASELNTLRGKTPSPTDENIAQAKEEKEHMKQFLNDFRKSFSPFPPAPKTDAKGFKTYLQTTILDLQTGAASAAVQLPANYAFSFSSQVEKLDFAPECIPPWMDQLQEIKAICSILYGAKINYLERLQRVPACKDDAGGPDYLGTTSVTNQNGVTTPYKITFLGFSAEIAAVLDGFQRSSNCFIVKTIDVSPSKNQPANPFATTPVAPAYYAAPAAVQPPNRYLTSRQAADGQILPGGAPPPRSAPAPTPVPAARPVVSSPPVPILWEKQLYVTMTVDVLKLKPAEH